MGKDGERIREREAERGEVGDSGEGWEWGLGGIGGEEA